MNDQTCIDFLQWCLPKLNYRWPGFRKVRRQVCKRISKRISELKLPDLQSYKDFLKKHQEEWIFLDSLCYITISRFYRDKFVFDTLTEFIFPSLCDSILRNNKESINCLCLGYSSGEEPYTIQIIWNYLLSDSIKEKIKLQITAIDSNPGQLVRAQNAIYSSGSIRELNSDLIDKAFTEKDSLYHLIPEIKKRVKFICDDIRENFPKEMFDLVFCRNLAFTYFNETLQLKTLETIYQHIDPGGYLIIGSHETLPTNTFNLKQITDSKYIFQKCSE